MQCSKFGVVLDHLDCAVPPALATGRIAHLNTAGDCCAAGEFASGPPPCQWSSKPRRSSKPYIVGVSAASLLNSSGV